MAVPRSEYTIEQAKRSIDELVQTFYRHLERDCRLKPSEIIKGGSLGHGTAIPGDFDIDLVLYSQDIDPDTVVEIGVDTVVSKLDVFLRKRLGDRYEFVRTTACSLQFKFDGYIEVDLLPSPYWGDTPDELHRYLKDRTAEDRKKFSCSAAKWQVKFFQKQPSEAKEYIKRFKAWRNSKWPKGKDAIGRPKSYLLSLLMIEAYKRSRDKTPRTIERKLKDMVHQHRSLDIKWNDDGYYDWTCRLTSEEFQSLITSGRFRLISSSNGVDIVYDNEQQRERRYYPAEVPSILDVANPFNNVYKSGIGNYVSDPQGGSFHPGTGTETNWTRFAKLIDTFDITIPVERY